MCLPRKKKQAILDGMREHRVLKAGGDWPGSVFPPTVCLWFWQGTQRLLHTQEPGATQSSVSGILVEHVRADDVRAICRYLQGCLSRRVIHRNQILAQYKEELSSSQDWPKNNVDSSGPWSCFQNGVAMIHSFFQQVLVESWPCARHHSGFWVCNDKHNRQTALSSWSLHSSGKSQMISST